MNNNNFLVAVYRGCLDSVKGVCTLVRIDKEMNDRLLSNFSPSQSPIRRKSDSTENAPVRPLKIHEKSKVLGRTFQCCVLNGGIFLLSVILFEYGLLPFIKYLLQLIFGRESFTGTYVWSWMKPLLSILFKTIWVLPLFILSKVVNSLWFQDIADSAYRYTRGRPHFIQSISKLMADFIFSIMVQTLFLMQATIIEFIPIYWVGYILSTVHMCLLYSLYAFEYKWINMGWELHHRLSYIENNWPYFIGFGFPLTLFTQLPGHWIISACVFSISFPIFIISANEANPVTGCCDYPLHLFSPVIKLSNYFLHRTIRSNRMPTKQFPGQTIR